MRRRVSPQIPVQGCETSISPDRVMLGSGWVSVTSAECRLGRQQRHRQLGHPHHTASPPSTGPSGPRPARTPTGQRTELEGEPQTIGRSAVAAGIHERHVGRPEHEEPPRTPGPPPKTSQHRRMRARARHFGGGKVPTTAHRPSRRTTTAMICQVPRPRIPGSYPTRSRTTRCLRPDRDKPVQRRQRPQKSSKYGVLCRAIGRSKSICRGAGSPDMQKSSTDRPGRHERVS